MPLVTIVIATYNRPALLRRTIQSVLQQTFQDWVLLVVGDCCGPETGEVIRAFGDERLFYVNLEERCGEQSGPNSAGMYAAQTNYVAFANHDDIWLPDHLELALGSLKDSKADFFAGAAAISVTAKDARTGETRLGVRAVSPAGRSVAEGYCLSPVYFEPVSSWVMRRSLVDKVGVWRPAATLYRTPLEDWILRAWRADVPMIFSDTVSAIYCNGALAKLGRSDDEQIYAGDAEEQDHWLAQMDELGAAGVRQSVAKDAAGFKNGTRVFEHTMRDIEKFHVFETLQTPESARLYKEFGWDGFVEACKILRYRPGFRLRTMLRRRTGEALADNKTWKDVAHFVKHKLGNDPRWTGRHAQ